jgi:hypothetical protein
VEVLMKRLLAGAAVVSLALAGSGCIVTSVYPFYSDNALVFEPSLVGKWVNDDGKESWTFAKQGGKAYRVEVIERKPGPAGDKGETQARTYSVRLFRLGSSQFLDAFPTDAPDITIGTHLLAKMELRDGTLTVRGLDTDAVDRAASEGGPLHVHPADDGTVQEAGQPGTATLFLAPTSRLQAFIIEHESTIFEKDGGVMKKAVGTDAGQSVTRVKSVTRVSR